MEVSLIDKNIKSADFVVSAGEQLNLNLASFASNSDCCINILVNENAIFNGTFIDFSSSDYNLKINVILKGFNSRCEWHSACLSKSTCKKIIDTSVFHQNSSTEATMSNYGICTENSKLVFTGISKIENGAKKSKTHQEAKIIVFDQKCDGKCSPVLKIDENDVEASHAAVVGRVNEDHLFYLESRGIPKAEAKKLITLGYLLPIKKYITDDDINKKIDEILEGNFIC